MNLDETLIEFAKDFTLAIGLVTRQDNRWLN
jgi:hypothetical protein